MLKMGMSSMLSVGYRLFVFLQILGTTRSENERILQEERIKKECLSTSPEMKNFLCLKSESIKIPCDDEDKRCSEWAGKGECQKNPQYMLVKCRKSCSSCITLHHGDEPQIAYDETRSKVLRRLYETQAYLHYQADRNIDTLQRCINKHSECTHWWSIGECKNNPQFMHTECSPACQTCDKIV